MLRQLSIAVPGRKPDSDFPESGGAQDLWLQFAALTVRECALTEFEDLLRMRRWQFTQSLTITRLEQIRNIPRHLSLTGKRAPNR